jgi:hypothetical protein
VLMSSHADDGAAESYWRWRYEVSNHAGDGAAGTTWL